MRPRQYLYSLFPSSCLRKRVLIGFHFDRFPFSSSSSSHPSFSSSSCSESSSFSRHPRRFLSTSALSRIILGSRQTSSLSFSSSSVSLSSLVDATADASATSPGSSSKPELLISVKAAERLNHLQKKLQAEKGAESSQFALRVAVDGGGCSGFQYTFSLASLDEDCADDDHVFERNGARVVVDDVSMEFLDGALLDFEAELVRQSFIVTDNPNAQNSCGCGVSFDAK